ncbi:outer membrane beta-barrel protein [Flammeovirga sp. EKP202]|uniref:outer membrane beta-barrel protein n=1 Tax=Flammeovirga sp. EKP202 TaxID=2770592 RepID=UPI00165FFEC6|nr:outer membrane beta-barrel protein [Flammeovirga sp. EKP202]MBD0404908.1 PorT family protein [Flammeovirga sp. EKP202]
MIKKTKLALINLLLLISINSYAQKDFRAGFIITHESDTIQGMVDYRSNTKNYESCIFKGKEGEKKYYPNQILGFGYQNDKLFSSQIIEGTFVEVLVTGKISLYKSKDLYHAKKGTDLIDLKSSVKQVTIDGKVGVKETSNWRGSLTYLISDCIENPSKITSSIQYSEKSLTRLFIQYNSCMGEEFTEPKADQPWTKFEYGILFGVSKSEINFSGEYLYTYLPSSYSSVDPTIGIQLAISSPRFTDRIAFQSELHFTKSSYSSFIETTSPINYFDTYVDINTLSIPLSLKYSFPEKKYGFYLQVGLNVDVLLSKQARLLEERVYDDAVFTYPETTAFEMKSNQIGYWGGIGVLRSFEKFKAGLTVRYTQMSELTDSPNYTASINRLSVNLVVVKK